MPAPYLFRFGFTSPSGGVFICSADSPSSTSGIGTGDARPPVPLRGQGGGWRKVQERTRKMGTLRKLLISSMAVAVTLAAIAFMSSVAGATTAHRYASQQASIASESTASESTWEKTAQQFEVGVPTAGPASSAGCPAGITQANSTAWAGYVACHPNPCL